MAQAVYTRKKRFEWVEKTLSEVGDGTQYPLEVTLDQIAEIFHRVKDAKFSSGYATVNTGDPETEPAFGYFIYSSTAITTDRAYGLSGGNLTYRGYTTKEEVTPITIDPANIPYLGDAYDAGNGDNYLDIADNERGILIQTILPSWNINTGDVVTAFSVNCSNPEASTDPEFFYSGFAFDLDPPTPAATSATVVFTGYIAVVKEAPNHSFIAPSNRYFIEMEFSAQDSIPVLKISTNEASISGSPTEISGCRYVMRLAGGAEVSCPIYADNTGYDFVGGNDFIHEATEWFPYQDQNGDVWNPTTGLPT